MSSSVLQNPARPDRPPLGFDNSRTVPRAAWREFLAAAGEVAKARALDADPVLARLLNPNVTKADAPSGPPRARLGIAARSDRDRRLLRHARNLGSGPADPAGT